MIYFRYWLRLPWPNKMLDEKDSAQISKSLGNFLHFWTKTQNFLPYASRHLALAFARSLQMTKT